MKVTILPQLSGEPEVMAMLQAFYSRSATPIMDRMEKLGDNVDSIKKSLAKFYIGYGHKSIGDCGFTTVFVEGVSIIAAKAVEDDPRFNGQECSTRYIDISGSVPDSEYPLSTEWRRLYLRMLPVLQQSIQTKYPFDQSNNASESVWRSGCNAKAFDIARGFLPASTLTNLSVTASLRTLREMCVAMSGSPINEVKRLAVKMNSVLKEHYPDSFGEWNDSELAEIKWRGTKPSMYYSHPTWTHTEEPIQIPEFNVDSSELQVLKTRPQYAALPPSIGRLVPNITINSTIDYGSWRDLQRHRRCFGVPPKLTPQYGLHPWYIEQLSDHAPEFVDEVEDLLQETQVAYNDAFISTYDFQGMVPLGCLVRFSLTMDLAQAIYLAELRSGPTVHATLRPLAIMLGEKLQGLGVKVHMNLSDTDIARRGNQDIKEK